MSKKDFFFKTTLFKVNQNIIPYQMSLLPISNAFPSKIFRILFCICQVSDSYSIVI